MARRQRIDRVRIRVPPERAIELAADPARFPHFNPLVEVPDGGRVDVVGNVYLVFMRPLLTVAIGLLCRRLARWIESAP